MASFLHMKCTNVHDVILYMHIRIYSKTMMWLHITNHY